jgi:hypothetical protein
MALCPHGSGEGLPEIARRYLTTPIVRLRTHWARQQQENTAVPSFLEIDSTLLRELQKRNEASAGTESPSLLQEEDMLTSALNLHTAPRFGGRKRSSSDQRGEMI